MIALSEPSVSGNEWKYIKECLDSGWVSSVGKYVTHFENMVAEYIGVKHSIATINGTSALHVSLIACGIQPGDEVIVPTLTFIAPVNIIRYCGAYPVFMDCDIETLCIDVYKVHAFINNECQQRNDGYCYNRHTNRRIKAIIPVHVFGHPSDMDMLCTICEEHNIDIIEDATESLGSEYKGRKAGSFGRVGCFSFNGNKIITTGGGGMVVSNDDYIAQKVRHLTTQAKNDPLEYDHDDIGYNYRLTNIQAAMGVAQMERLEEFIAIKRNNAMTYKNLLYACDDVDFSWERCYVKSNFWFYSIFIPKEDKKGLMDFLLSKDIQVRPIWKLIHTLTMYRKFFAYKIENADIVYTNVINIPCSVSLKQEDMEYVVNHIIAYFYKK
ncbi:MAG: LegC family aminotransferase [Nitrospirae bacterium]|nr:LegC family aminotransferase [Nitrospirota bacterium]